jgi:hypothetical protein
MGGEQQDISKLGPLWRFCIGAFALACGIIPILAALDIGSFSEGKHAPDWVVGVAGGLFVLLGIYIWTAGTRFGKASGTLVALVMVSALAAIGNWVAFGAGPRVCTSSISGFLFTSSRAAGEIECRAAFGIGAVMTNGIVLLFLSGLIKSWFGAGRFTRLLEKVGMGAVLLGLLPFLLLLVIIALMQGGRDGLRKKWDGWRAKRSGGDHGPPGS